MNLTDDSGYDVINEAREIGIYDYLFYAAKCGLLDDVHEELFDFDYVRRKLSVLAPRALIADIELALGLEDHNRARGRARRKALTLLRDAVSMSAQVIATETAQIPGQLLGRLLDTDCPELAPMVKAASKWKGDIWIRPQTGSLWRAGGPLLRVFSGAGRWPGAIAVRPDGSEILAISSDGMLRIWDLHSGDLVHMMKSPSEPADEIELLVDDNSVIATVSSGYTMFTDSRGRHQRTLKVPKSRVAPVVTPDQKFIIVAADDRSFRICSGDSGIELQRVNLHKGRVTAMIALADSRRIASGSEDGRIMIWDLNTGHNLASLAGHSNPITALASLGGDGLVSASDDQTVRVWDVNTRKNCRSLKTMERVVTIKVPQEKQLVVMACSDGSLGVWDIASSKDYWVSSGGRNPALAVSGDGCLAVTTATETLRLWDLDKIRPIQIDGEGFDTWRFLKSLNRVTGTRRQLMNVKRIETVAIDETGTTALTGAFDGDIDRWWLERLRKDDLLLERHLAARHAALGVTTLLALRGHSGIAGVSACGNYLQAWDWWGDECRSWRAHSDVIDGVVLGRNDVIISAGRNGKIKIWDLNSRGRPRRLRTLRHHWFPLIAKSFVADKIKRRQGLTISSAVTMLEFGRFKENEGTYAEGAKPTRTMPAYERETFIALSKKHFGGVLRLAVSSDGRTLVSGAYESVKVWNVGKGRAARTIRCTDGFVAALAVAPDSSRVLAASGNSIGVFDLATGQRTAELNGHTASVYDLDITSDGGRVLSASQDRTLRLWDLTSGQLLATFTADAPLYCCRVAPDGAQIVAGDEMGGVHFLKIEESR